MQISGKSPWIGIALIAGAAVLMQGCAVAAVATVAAGGGVGYAISQEPGESTASAAPAEGDDMSNAPGASGEADTGSASTEWTEPTDSLEPTMLVEPQAPVESVEVQPIQ
jgi:hypothetical protein